MRLRLLPITLLICCFFLVVKVAGMVTESEKFFSFFIQDINAEPTKPDTTEADKKMESDKNEKPTKTDEKAQDGEQTQPDNTALDSTDSSPTFTPEEINILQRLDERRKALDMQEKDLVLKQNVLHATENRIDDKLQQLKTLHDQVGTLLADYQDKENKKIDQLVKIYENMKPKEAAPIFERTELSVLLDILVRMPEKKSAPILAKMDPQLAKEATTALALRKRLPDN